MSKPIKLKSVKHGRLYRIVRFDHRPVHEGKVLFAWPQEKGDAGQSMAFDVCADGPAWWGIGAGFLDDVWVEEL